MENDDLFNGKSYNEGLCDADLYSDESTNQAARYDLLEWDFVCAIADRMAKGLRKGRAERDYLTRKPRKAYIRVKINHAMKHLMQFQLGGSVENLAACAANCMIAFVLTKMFGPLHPYLGSLEDEQPASNDNLLFGSKIVNPICRCGHERARHTAASNWCRDCGCSIFEPLKSAGSDPYTLSSACKCGHDRIRHIGEGDWCRDCGCTHFELPVLDANSPVYCECGHALKDHSKAFGACNFGGCYCLAFKQPVAKGGK